MTENLNAGTGTGKADFRLAISIADAVLHMSYGPNVFQKLTKALHRHNRHAKPGNFLAIAFPHMAHADEETKMRAGFLQFGADIDIFGTREAIDAFKMDNEVQKLLKRGMVTSEDSSLEGLSGEGTAFVRDRRFERTVSGYTERVRRRAERKDLAPVVADLHKTKREAVKKIPHVGFFRTGKDFLVHFTPVTGASTQEFEVSTYGLSRKDSPSPLLCRGAAVLRDMSDLITELEEI